jgi:hypothetical protein
MAKAFFLVLLSIGLIGLASADKPDRPPFQMRVVEEQTDVGLANLRVVTANGIACYTRANADVSWGESSLMDRDVRFEIEDPRDSLALPPLPSESHTVDTQNLNFADVISFLGFFCGQYCCRSCQTVPFT